jgi:hypothetical protein
MVAQASVTDLQGFMHGLKFQHCNDCIYAVLIIRLAAGVDCDDERYSVMKSDTV